MSIKSFLTELVPYCIIKKRCAVRYKKQTRIHLDKSLPPIAETTSKFEFMVSVQGLGFSGSGAVVDLLREYPSCLVLGTIDVDGSQTKGDRNKNGEVDILRHSGGLFEIENYLLNNNPFHKDALMKRFIRLVDTTDIFKIPELRMLANQFYNSLVEFEINTEGHFDYNAHLANVMRPDSNIKVMKDLTVAEYQYICRNFLASLTNFFYEDGKTHIVLDQSCQDGNYDTKRNLKYLPNLKTIVVYRDPRDVYFYAVTRGVTWIAHNNVDTFISWFKNEVRLLELNSEDYLVIRFEDLINNYPNQVEKIEDYLGLDSHSHNKFRNLNPDISRKNIGIWKSMPSLTSDYEVIKNTLPIYCYE